MKQITTYFVWLNIDLFTRKSIITEFRLNAAFGAQNLRRISKLPVPQGSLLSGPLLFNIFLNDLNFAGQSSSLRLYADDTTTYASDLDSVTLEISLNQDLNVLVAWFSQNYLIVNSIKTQGMVLGSHTHVPDFFIGETKVELANSLKIFGVTIDCKLTYCEHISNMLKKVYAKIGVLRRLKRLMPRNVSLSLYKAYLLGILQPTTYWNK